MIRITVRGVIMGVVIIITTVIVWIWVSVVIGVRGWVIIWFRIRLPL
jgi:hypothetical protein